VALKLKHPNIVRTFQVGEAQQPGSSEKLYYLVMEYLEGETLDEVLQRRRQFPPGEAVRLIYQSLQGLQHLFEKGLVHRDLKPANLMLVQPSGSSSSDTLQATVKILDMGLARALSDEVLPDPERMEQPHLTSEGIVLGTPDYMAPEQARDARSADIRADIYSLGCVLYHLLDGRPPFPDTNIISQMIRHATEQPRPLKEANPAVPDALQQVINWMMAKDPAQRCPTPERALQALQGFLAAGAAPAPGPEADPKMKPYLTWLEIDTAEFERRAAAGAAPRRDQPPPTVPVAVPKPPAVTVPTANPLPVAKPMPERPRAKAARRKGKKGRKSAPGIDLPTSKKQAPPAAESPAPVPIDVELVPLSALDGPPQKVFSFPLTRRDFAMFVIGVSTVILGGGLGILAAWFAGAFGESSKSDGEKTDED
jgi:serine/threonine protein kinase